MIVSNSVKCHKCGDEIYSAHRHDYKSCSCGNIAVDGGMDYLRRGGAGLVDGSYTDLSIDLPKDVVDACIEAWDNTESRGSVCGELYSMGYNFTVDMIDASKVDTAVKWARDNNRNSRGIVYAIFRALRDSGIDMNKLRE